MFFLIMLHFKLKTTMFAFYGFSLFIIFFGAASAAVSADEKCVPETLLDVKNRDEVKPTFPLINDDPRLKPSNIVKAHKILRDGLQQFLEFREEDLGFYLNHIVVKKPAFKDEYGQEIRTYYKIFKFIWVQFNETLCQNYAIKQYDLDKLDLCSVARFLSHQSAVDDRETIMNRMGDALGYRCHPCTPYKRKEHDETLVPHTDDISPIESLSMEQILVLCKDYDHNGQKMMVSSTAPPSTTSTFTTAPTTVVTRSTTVTTATKGPVLELIGAVGEVWSTLFDFTPCSYFNDNCVCNQVPLEEIKKVFDRTLFMRLRTVDLILQPYVSSETFIPRDVFGSKRILNIRIGYPFEAMVNRSLSLQVNAGAFRWTKSFTTNFAIHTIDCTLLDLGFLTGFDQLTQLVFANISNIHLCLPSLPPLPRLTKLHFGNCAGMNHLNIFPTLTNGLELINFVGGNNIEETSCNDETVNRIIDWLLLSSAHTLEKLIITEMKKVTRVPHNIASFTALSEVWLEGNNISTIKSGAFSFSAPVSELRINDNEIKEIEPGAFQGDFKDAVVLVFTNNLTRFEESIFGPMLQQMASGKGLITLDSGDNRNPIDCSEESICHLAWLKRYEVEPRPRWYRHLFSCSNGTFFRELQPAGFNHCPL